MATALPPAPPLIPDAVGQRPRWDRLFVGPLAASQVLLAILLVAAALLCWRRLAGALVCPPDWRLLLAAALPISTVAALYRRLSPRSKTWYLASAALAVFALSLSFPAASVLGWAVLWTPIVLEETSTWLWLRARRASRHAERSEASPPVPSRSFAALRMTRAEPEIPSSDVTQQFTRTIADDGSEVFSGWLRLAMTAAQRTAAGHVAFCPPFEHVPEVTVTQRQGPPARIKVAQTAVYGIRLDVRVPSPPPEPAHLLFQVEARCPPHAKASTQRVEGPNRR